MKAGSIVALILMSTLWARETAVQLKWTKATMFPGAGLAGVFTGVNNNVLLIAGGSNFPGLKPWEGGKKQHYNEVYALRKKNADGFAWISSEIQLKEQVAYGASATLPDGVICAGGETANASSSRNTFLMRWDPVKQQVTVRELPPLPLPLANACMAGIGRKAYLIGGESNGLPSSKAFVLNLSAAHPVWQELPDLPIAMSHSVAVAQYNGKRLCMYVIGGRSSTPSGISELHHTNFCFDPELRKWYEMSPVSNGGRISNFSAGIGVALNKHEIMLAGGDDGQVFHQIETYNAEIAKTATDEEKKRLQARKLALINHHEGFCRDVLIYNTLTNGWRKQGELPFLPQVTTTAVLWDKDIFIPGGEIKPGLRTADVMRGSIK